LKHMKRAMETDDNILIRGVHNRNIYTSDGSCQGEVNPIPHE